MSETIPFLPERLNRKSVVYRGMTISEIFIMASIGVIAGIVIGILIMVFLGDFVWVPTAIFPCLIISVRFGGVYLSRLKRGKPDSWLERYIAYKRSPLKFITASRHWSIKRTPKRGK